MSATVIPATDCDTTLSDIIPDIYIPRPLAAEMLSVCDRRIVILAREGKLKARRILGGREKYRLRDVLLLLAAS